MGYKYSDEQLIEAVKTSGSVRQVLGKLGLKEAGGNYACIKKKIALMDLDTSHFHGMSWNKGKTTGPRRPIEYYLTDRPCQSHRLKERLITDGLKDHRCEMCGITEWNGKPTPIELDHIDGNHNNNNLDNLRILCPNCHAQTDNYRGKNKGSY